MFDFNNIMTSLGFEAESITNAFTVCTTLIDEVRAFAMKRGYENDAESLYLDFDGNYPDDAFADRVRVRIMNDLWRVIVQDDNLTPHIVTSCYDTTFEILEGTKLFKTLDARFSGSMPLTFQCGDGKIYDLGDIEDLDGEVCAEVICNALDRELSICSKDEKSKNVTLVEKD